MTPPVLSELSIGGPAAPWARLGFHVADGGAVRVGATTIRLQADAEHGIRSWTLAGSGEGDIDGLPTTWMPAGGDPGDQLPPHPNGALLLDHVVVITPDLGRTTTALERVGLACRRTRQAETGGRAVVQAFFRLGEVILELVGPPQEQGDGPPAFWGLVAVVADLEACATSLGADVGAVRDAVQPGRRIATVRRSAGVGVALALMSPDPSHGRPPAG